MTTSEEKWIIAWEPIRLPTPPKKHVLLFHSIYPTQDEAFIACDLLRQTASGETRYRVAPWPHELDPEPDSIVEIEDGIARPFVPRPPKWVLARLEQPDQLHPKYLYYSGYDTEQEAKAALEPLPHIESTPPIAPHVTDAHPVKGMYEIAYWPYDIIPDADCSLTIEDGIARHYKDTPFQRKAIYSLYQLHDLHDSARRYVMVATIRLNQLQDLDELAQLGPDWSKADAVTLFINNPKPISKGDVAELIQLDSTLSTYQYDGNRFIDAPLDILHQHTTEKPKPAQHTPSPTPSSELIKQTKKHRL